MLLFCYKKVKKLSKVEQNYIRFDNDHKYDCHNHILYRDNKEIELTKKEILFLELFMTNLNRIVTYDEIENYVWEGEESNLNNIRALIKRIRKKLPEDAIQIVTGYGYTLNKNCKYS